MKATLAVGARSVGAMAQFTPFVFGETMTLADIYLRYALAIPKLVGPGQLGWNVLEECPASPPGQDDGRVRYCAPH
ncbi:MAG: hypothetical protein R3E50_14325 [Halioglobus sp.]